MKIKLIDATLIRRQGSVEMNVDIETAKRLIRENKATSLESELFNALIDEGDSVSESGDDEKRSGDDADKPTPGSNEPIFRNLVGD